MPLALDKAFKNWSNRLNETEQAGGSKTPDVIATAKGALKRQRKCSSLTVAKYWIEEAVTKDDSCSDGSNKVFEYGPSSRTAPPGKRLQHSLPDEKTSAA